MKYISTRGSAASIGFEDATLSGIAPDGGLWIPESVPEFSSAELQRLSKLSHVELVAEVMRPFTEGGELTFAEFQELIRAAYGAQWDDARIAPVKKLEENRYILELFHGPTLAFKDHALQALGRVQPYILQKRKQSIVIVVATSGDTGPAAIEGFAGKAGVEIFVLFPEGGTSEFQRRQMTTVADANVHAIAIRGSFDDCQDIVKALKRPSVNSINWFRIAAQIPYYFSSAFSVMRETKASSVSFAVPCGNFGNMYAGIMAKRMGLPVDTFIAASNENNMLVDFIERGVYRPRAVTPTNSPSVDIGKSSNIERLVRDLVHDPAVVRTLFEDNLPRDGQFTISPEGMRERGLISGWIDTESRLQTMREVYTKFGYEMDPHTANAYAVGKKLHTDGPLIIHATASPVKFEDAIQEAIGKKPEMPERFRDIGERPERGTVLDNDSAAVGRYIDEVLIERSAS